jgi:hypothetical protein
MNFDQAMKAYYKERDALGIGIDERGNMGEQTQRPEIEFTPTQYRILKEWYPAYGRIAGGIFIEEAEQRDGSIKFAVRMRHWELSKSGEWDFAPASSERTDEYLASHRWDSLDEAKDAAWVAAQKVGRKAD